MVTIGRGYANSRLESCVIWSWLWKRQYICN